ncbi:MAG: AarF/UbiB family protein [Candidatus Aureabacteria bacterium]|nr:AarF/UbiB family protein [Candidatus Auribacterota bacterium]
MRYLSLIRRRDELVRFRQVMAVLFRHGFGYFVYELKLADHLPLVNRFLKHRESAKPLNIGERLRLAFEELGPTFVKFGQILSTRVDLIPADVVRELTKLQDRAAPFPTNTAREIIIAELGRRPEEMFAEFDPEPMAAASMAQVHRAVLRSGEKVVVKVQRPGIQKQIATDLNILEALANGLERYIHESRAFCPADLVRFFRKMMAREIDFLVEARNAERFRRNLSDEKEICIPKVFWDFSSSRVLVMEDIEGIRVDDHDRLQEMDIDVKKVALNGARAFLKQVFVDKFFHADPHPGNFSVLPDGRIALIDFGMVGRLSSEHLEELAGMLLAIAEWDAAKAAHHLLRLRTSEEEIDEESFKSDLAYIIEGYSGRPLKEINLGHILNETISIASRYQLKMPPDLVLLGKAVVNMEGVGRILDPEFDMIAVAREYARGYILSKLRPAQIKWKIEEMAGDLFGLLRELPGDLQLMLRKAAKGRFKLEFQHRGLDTFIAEMDKSSNRLSFGLIVAALIIGSSLVTLSDKGPHILGLPLFGLAGFLLAGLLGLWLIFGILKSGRL